VQMRCPERDFVAARGLAATGRPTQSLVLVHQAVDEERVSRLWWLQVLLVVHRNATVSRNSPVAKHKFTAVVGNGNFALDVDFAGGIVVRITLRKVIEFVVFVVGINRIEWELAMAEVSHMRLNSFQAVHRSALSVAIKANISNRYFFGEVLDKTGQVRHILDIRNKEAVHCRHVF